MRLIRARCLTGLALAGLLLAACSENMGPAPGFPSRVVVLEGEGQVGEVGTPLSEPIVVQVTDSDGVPVRNVRVTWYAEDEGGIASPAASTSDPDGITQTVWTLGDSVGEQSLRVTPAGVSPTFVTAEAVPGPADQLAAHNGGSARDATGTRHPRP